MTTLDATDIEIIRGLFMKGMSAADIAIKMGADVREVVLATAEMKRETPVKGK